MENTVSNSEKAMTPLAGVRHSTGCVVCGKPSTVGIGNAYQMTHQVCEEHINAPDLHQQINRVNEGRRKIREANYRALTGNGFPCLGRL